MDVIKWQLNFWVVRFWSEIILVISDQIALHSVQLPLLTFINKFLIATFALNLKCRVVVSAWYRVSTRYWSIAVSAECFCGIAVPRTPQCTLYYRLNLEQKSNQPKLRIPRKYYWASAFGLQKWKFWGGVSRFETFNFSCLDPWSRFIKA